MPRNVPGIMLDRAPEFLVNWLDEYVSDRWRAGAHAGATPREAFFVGCGLGTTMSTQDILEGRMNVEIGVAVVRPAEFVVLKLAFEMRAS